MKSVLALTLAVLTAMLLPCSPVKAEQPTDLTLIAINVGKADCLILQSGSSVYMIDTGTAESWGAVSAALKCLNISHLNGVIITHTDRDHAGGAWALATSSIEVDAWYSAKYCSKYEEKKHPAILAAALRNEEVQWLVGGDSLPLDGGTLSVLGPLSYSETENCNSVVLMAEGGGGNMLLAGDMEFPEEDELMEAGVLGLVDVLKVGNHGESDATSDEFADLIKPRLSVISTNSIEEPDTPAKRVLKALSRVGSQIVITQQASGAVRVTLSGGEITTELLGWNLPNPVSSVRIAEKNTEDDTIILHNSGSAAVDLSDWYLLSEKGNQIFVLPKGTTLAAGADLIVSALDSPSEGDLIWPEKKVWHKSGEDTAILCDAYGREMSRLE